MDLIEEKIYNDTVICELPMPNINSKMTPKEIHKAQQESMKIQAKTLKNVSLVQKVVSDILDSWIWSSESLKELSKKPLNIYNFPIEIRWLMSSLFKYPELREILSKMELFIDGYLCQLVWKTDCLIRFCKWEEEVFANNSLKELWEWMYVKKGDNSHMVTKIYDHKTLKNIDDAIKKLMDWTVTWYHKIFPTIDWVNLWWATHRIPNSDWNIRFWFPLLNVNDFNNNVDEYRKYVVMLSKFMPWTDFNNIESKNNFRHYDFNQSDLWFFTTANALINTFNQKNNIRLSITEKKQLDKLVNYLFVSALTLDYFLKYNPSPSAIYKDNEFPRLSESFVKMTGYTRKELEDYYKKHWEITTLLYKWEDLEEVIRETTANKESSSNKEGYKNKYFTMTTKDGTRIRIPWTNIMYNWISFRTANIWKMQILS